jgi:peroxiredoxin (alkyl hydroperoxide reductase subunit C)
MRTIGDHFPMLHVKAVVGLECPGAFANNSDPSFAGEWQVTVFWPKDFTSVCPTEIAVGRNSAEVLRVQDALQTDELWPCNWHKCEQTLTAA